MLDTVPFLISDLVAIFFTSWIYWKIPAESFVIFFARKQSRGGSREEMNKKQVELNAKLDARLKLNLLFDV